ncbi:dTDP-4-dehydrorhamnose reductase [Corynebacterium silvaticum]|uniref:dTDP-4-dehydrorhamnose reductase n=1 Tax=Corynebacterium silvaticum TaxID=2320431 RepID=A0A7Y4LKS9_9CORY|nr:dTDP-4-dehydrorhamnose reductase [Corynebacterium silvaticum]ARU45414.1 dTDP-4-dehydrorhamnose reductase [Corynebacterium silvaticum]MBH5299985.1 dTDP-4-dehydrorhamnose reductase [Corynebacterium silvaticum]NOM65490.1 dTDP-4-dehydrorhamnose reductase [Corynebacterium silvaticum]NON70647.1 dTDP-4-dehydrorhamnose reductase [Corynebacterium silvaticum]TFA92311.1 dTDP-4-dehydrorhamnose reductase [Corynebacterium silvaticum]
MKIETCSIQGMMVIHLDLHEDSRGWFKENWQESKLADLGFSGFRPVQNNISFNAEVGVTRGLHAEPWDKYVSVATGSVFGAWCDLREGSATFGATFTLTITPEIAVFVPRGVANGFQALESTAYTYLVNDHWSPDAHYSFVNLADPALNISWPIPLDHATLSDKDMAHPPLTEATPVPPKKMLITGGNGQLGQALKKVFPHAEVCSRAELDITSDITEARRWADYSVIINAAAYTAVDTAETDSAAAWRTNAEAPARLAAIAARYGITLVHISSDYVFDGTCPIHDEHEPFSPLSVYGQSKAAGDTAVSVAPQHYVVRTSWVVGEGKNFVSTMASLAARGVSPQVVDDQLGRLTFTDDLAAGIQFLLDNHAPYGVYNLSNSGEVVSWAQVAQRVFELAGRSASDVQPLSTAEYFADTVTAAPRPQYSALDLSKITKLGFSPRDWQDVLAHYYARYCSQYCATSDAKEI